MKNAPLVHVKFVPLTGVMIIEILKRVNFLSAAFFRAPIGSFDSLNDTNAEELAYLAEETGALVLCSWLHYPDPKSGGWQVEDEVLGVYWFNWLLRSSCSG